MSDEREHDDDAQWKSEQRAASQRLTGFLCGRGSRSKRAPQPVPPLAERKAPPLSVTLTHEQTPRACQSCGAAHAKDNVLRRWMECDEWDQQPTKPACVVLCDRCSKRLIDAHPRLYKELWPGSPFPGCMSVCLKCAHRVGTSCSNADASVNGGAGLRYTWAHEPTYAHFNYGGGRGETRYTFHGPVLSCTGFIPQTGSTSDDEQTRTTTT